MISAQTGPQSIASKMSENFIDKDSQCTEEKSALLKKYSKGGASKSMQ